MKNSNSKGKWGEDLASKYLMKKDYTIIDRNYKTKFGEIDIICRRNEEIIFVEVKMRSNFNYRKALGAISPSKIEKLRKTALIYIQEKFDFDVAFRFDVVMIHRSNNRTEIRHIENAIYEMD